MNAKLLLKIAIIATYPLLALSCLLIMGMSFGMVFIVGFTVENRTSMPISVTPIGTAGKEGRRHALPVYAWRIPPVFSSKSGGFQIPPGGSVEIMYDFDDINFSEIVVEDANGERGQLITDPTPTLNQYHGPSQKVFVVDDLAALAPIPEDVHDACKRAKVTKQGAWVFNGLTFFPWIVYYVLLRISKSYAVKEA